MTNRYTSPSTTTAEVAADYLDRRDEEVMQALVTAGAFVALADGQLQAVERHELVNFINRRGFAPTISQREIAEAFDNRVQQIEDRDSAKVILKALRPLAGLSLASVVVRTGERVAAADRKIHPGELRALKLIRQVMMTQSIKRPPAANALLGTSLYACTRDGALIEGFQQARSRPLDPGPGWRAAGFPPGAGRIDSAQGPATELSHERQSCNVVDFDLDAARFRTLRQPSPGSTAEIGTPHDCRIAIESESWQNGSGIATPLRRL